MKNIILALRSLGKRGQHNILKVISLGIGLAVGLVLIAKVCFEQSYDNFYPDADRIYRIYSLFTEDGKLEEFQNTSGGVPILLRDLSPDIETASRATFFSDGPFTMSDTDTKLKATIFLADSCFFDVLSRPMLVGDAKETLSRPLYALVSDETAERIGGDVVGKTFTFDVADNIPITIGGIFKAYPDNATMQADILLSLPSAVTLWGYDGSMNTIGNDRYRSYIKLRPGADIGDVESLWPEYMSKYVPEHIRANMSSAPKYSFRPLAQVHTGDSYVKRMCYMMGLIALALIFTAVMNYLLIVVSSLVGRAKEMAVRKSYGASSWNIHSLLFSEAFVHVLLAVALALLLLLAFREVVAQMVGTSLGVLLVSGGAAIIVICLLILFITGYIPGSLFARIPVAAAFRSYRESKRSWKLALLFVQFAAAAFLVTLLLVVNLQYNRMVNDNPGYDIENLAFANILSISDTTRRAAFIEELRRLPDIADVTTCDALPMYGFGGNVIKLPGDDRELLNVADMYNCSANFLDFMDIKVIDGTTFNPAMPTESEVMLSRECAERLRKAAGWGEESVVGKYIFESAHHQGDVAIKQACIVGVFENIRVGTAANSEMDVPVTLYYHPAPSRELLVRFHSLNPESLHRVNDAIARFAPDKEIFLQSYAAEMEYLYHDTRNFRDAVLAGGLVTLAIVFIGLVGYTADEVNRRRKEMAIRKINGATSAEVTALFLRDVSRIALPAILIGCLVSFLVAQNWQAQYAEKVSLAWYLFLAGGMAVLAVVAGVSVINVYRAAEENPVNSLRAE